MVRKRQFFFSNFSSLFGVNSNHRACAFWRYFSIELSNIYDPIRKDNYKPLIIDERWWKTKYNFSLDNCTQYGCIPEQVIEHIRGVISPKYKTVMELIYQSNPSLLLVTNYQLRCLYLV